MQDRNYNYGGCYFSLYQYETEISYYSTETHTKYGVPNLYRYPFYHYFYSSKSLAKIIDKCDTEGDGTGFSDEI